MKQLTQSKNIYINFILTMFPVLEAQMNVYKSTMYFRLRLLQLVADGYIMFVV